VTRGLLLFIAICLLAAMPLVDRRAGQVAVGVLFAMWILTLRTTKQASATRRREDLKTNGERGASGSR
jgi:hypothetical protein